MNDNRTTKQSVEIEATAGVVTIVTNPAGECVAVTRCDTEGRILKIIWQRQPDEPAANEKVRIIVQAPGEVPQVKGPFPPALVERFLVEFYQCNPNDIAIVVPGLPVTCYPQHGKEFIAMAKAERGDFSETKTESES